MTPLHTRSFWIVGCILLIWSGILAALPLTGILGMEFSFLFGIISTIVLSHFSLNQLRHRAQHATGPGLTGTLLIIWGWMWVLLLPSLALISANALRIKNCNFPLGFAYFGMYVGCGTCFALAMGAVLGLLRRKWLATTSVYLVPVVLAGWTVAHGLLHPPIFAYGHYFGFYPGSLYDELRSISDSFILFRLTTLSLSAMFIGIVALFAGKNGLFLSPVFRWRDAVLGPDEQADDGRLTWHTSRDASVGTLIWLILSTGAFGLMYNKRYQWDTIHTNASIQRALGGRYETPHFILYYDQHAMPPEMLKKMARDHEYRYDQLVRFFGHRPKYKIESYLFKSATQKSRLMGAANTMIARPWAYQFYIHGYYAPHNVLKHEMAHVFSAQFGTGPLKISARQGVFINTALIEGVAMAADWSRGSMTPHTWSRAMLDAKVAPDPAALLGPTGFFRYASWSAYTIAGSFSRYLIDNYGMAKYKRAYGRGEFQKVYGKPLRVLSNEWKVYLQRRITLSPQAKRIVAYRFLRYRSIFSRVCPHEIASLRSQVSALSNHAAYPKAIAIQQNICRLSPKAHHKLQLLRLHVAAKNNAYAERQAKRMLRLFPAKQRPILHAKLQTIAGKLAYRRGDRRAALAHFRIAAEHHVYRGSRRSAAVTIHALLHPKWTKVIMDYLEQSSDTGALLALQQAQINAPQQPMLAYLLGRRYYYARQYKRALSLFHTAQIGLKGVDFRNEIIRLRARAHYELGHYLGAATLFQKLARQPITKGRKLTALDWKKRAMWEHRIYKHPPTKK